MAIGLIVAETLCTRIGKLIHAKVMAVLFRHKNQLDALIQFTYILVDV